MILAGLLGGFSCPTEYVNDSATINDGMSHILAKEKHAFRLFLCVDNCCYLIMRNIGNASLNRLDFVGKSLLVFVRQLLTVFGSKNHSE